MSYEPRMRGSRFRRPAAKKASAKERKAEEQSSFYEEPIPTDPEEVRSYTRNSLEHLGNQRFALPPYFEHFQRWIKDVNTLLIEFGNQLPDASIPLFQEKVAQILTKVQDSLTQRIDAENTVSHQMSEIQRQLSSCETQLASLEHAYKMQTREVRRRYEQSFDKLHNEINTLDRQRLRILNTKPTLLQRLFRKSESRLEEKASALRSRKDSLGNRKEALKLELETERSGFESKRKQLVEEQENLRAKLSEVRGNKLDDALEIRKAACEELRRAVDEAIEKLLQQ